MNNLFVCNSTYQLLIAFFFCELECKDDNNYLLLDEYLYNSIRQEFCLNDSSYFKDIICVPDNQMELTIKDHIVLYEIERVCMYNWGTPSSKYIYNNYDFDFILLDEGLGSYKIGAIWAEQGVDFSKVRLVYLLEPELSWDNTLCVKELNIRKVFDNQNRRIAFLSRVNKFFNYKKQDIASIVYFDRYFVSENTLSSVYEKWFIDNLLMVLEDYSFEIKTHPSENIKLAKLRYSRCQQRLSLNASKIPWELYLLNMTEKESIVVMSINSSPIIISLIFGEIISAKISTICLLDIVRSYIADQETYIDSLVSKYNLLHRDNSIHCPASFTELSLILSSMLKTDLDKQVGICEKYEESETAWLRKCVKDYSELFGNLLGTVYMHCYKGNELAFEEYQLFFLENSKIVVKFPCNGRIEKYDRVAFQFQLDNFKLQIVEATLHANGINFYIDPDDCVNSNHITFNLSEIIDACDMYLSFDIKKPLFEFDYRKYN